MGVLADQIGGLVFPVAEVEAARESCRDELARTQADLTAANARIAELESELAECRGGFLPLTTGLVTTGFSAPDGRHGWVPNLLWRDIEPSKGVYDFSQLDTWLAGGNVARVRLMCGMYSPDWLKSEAGAVTMVNQTDGKTGVCPRWWKPLATDAYARLVADEIAPRYDGAFAAISMSAGMTIYAEPLMRELSSATTRTNLQAAGFTAIEDLAALRDGMAAHTPFRRTRTFMAFNPYMRLNPDGTFDLADLETAVGLMGDLRSALPSAIVQNNSIRTPTLGGDYPGLYAAMTEPKSFQTAGAARIGSVYDTLAWAVEQGAHLVESYAGFDAALSDAQEAEIEAGLRANGG